MDENKKIKVKEILLAEWEKYSDKNELADVVMKGFIFGTYGQDEHYLIDEFKAIIAEIELEKNPPTEEKASEV